MYRFDLLCSVRIRKNGGTGMKCETKHKKKNKYTKPTELTLKIAETIDRMSENQTHKNNTIVNHILCTT